MHLFVVELQLILYLLRRVSMTDVQLIYMV
jgi:hypothetical protein